MHAPNALRNGIENAVFFTGATEKILPPLVRQGLRPDVVVIDPPRKGCDPAVLDAILRAQPTRVVYVSCALPTLARDAKILCAGGYRVSRVPMCGHVLLDRGGGDRHELFQGNISTSLCEGRIPP